MRVTDLTKRYKTTLALNHLTLEVPTGALFGLLGPNGAGKSTLIRLLLGFIFPDAGRIERGPFTPDQIGYLPERPYFPPRCPIREYLWTVGRVSNLPASTLPQIIAARLQQVGLAQAANWPIGACSKGMLQRLGLAAALLSDPPFLILDEPTSGLDPAWQKVFRELIQQLHGQGKTILFSTHRLSEVAELCTHVAILNKARLVRAGTLEEVLPFQPQVTIALTDLPPAVSTRLQALHPEIVLRDSQVTLNGQAVAHKAEVLRLLLDAGLDIQHLGQQRTTLEEFYLEALRQ
jgi:ABC-2 type transport system ATP-binding protein